MLNRLRSLWRALTFRKDFEQGMSEELRFHMEQHTDELVRSGVPRDEAARRARMELGVNTVVDDCREARGLHFFDELSRELRYAFRLLRKTPGFTLTALVTIGLCLGANLAIFAVIDAILIRSLPFPDADRLVTIFNTYPKAGVDRDGASLTNYYERRGNIPAFSSLSIYRSAKAIVGETGSTEREAVMRVSPEFFTTLGVSNLTGRAFSSEETSFQTDRVAILTDTYWREHFSGDPAAIGRQIRVDGVEKTIVGVLPREFRFLSFEPAMYFPLASRLEDRLPAQRHSGGNVTQMIARLQPGATFAQAQAQIDAQNAALELDDPQARMMAAAGFRSAVVPLHADYVAAIRPTLLLLQAGVLALLLIGGVNLVNLLLIRASGRVKELAVRQALGASRRNVVSETVVETTLLTVAGGLLGLAIGAGGIRLLDVLGVDRLPLGSHIVFNSRLAILAMLAAIALGIVLAVPVAWFHLRRHVQNALQSETRGGTTGRAAQSVRHGFIVGQIALAFVLLAGAGMLGMSLERAMAVSPGFESSHILTGQISLPRQHYPNSRARVEFVERLTGAIAREPGVTSVGVVNNVPFSGNSGKSAATVKGHVLRPGESPRGHYSYGVAGDYFHAMEFSLRAGRFLTDADSVRAARVCVVDEDFAKYYWPDSNALGQHLFEGSGPQNEADAFTVVGVAGRVKQSGLTDESAQGAIYYPYIFRTDDAIFVAVRSSLPPESLSLRLQQIVRQIDSDLPLNDLRSMDARIADSLIARRSPALLAGLFSAIALLLTVIGTYGVMSYAVSERRREIGVRMALGARPEQIRRQFLSLAIRLLASGTLLGLVGAWLTGQAMRTILFHVAAFDTFTLACACCIIGAACLAAALIPSGRAARISPLKALADQP